VNSQIQITNSGTFPDSAKKNASSPLALIKTFGCQQNVSDSEKIKNILLKMGYNLTEQQNKADLIIFNTCAVREHAEDRVFGNLGELKNLKAKKPSLIIAVCGCMMEEKSVREKLKKSYPFVDLVFGTGVLEKIPLIFNSFFIKKKPVFYQKSSQNSFFEEINSFREDKTKAFVQIMSGCNNFCSYCIVPYVRGREQSREPHKIMEEINNLISEGYKEITLLGQNVNFYGNNLKKFVSFTQLLKNITKINGDYWIRFMTSHPKDITRELIDEIADNPKICKHIHLPLQSGSNKILEGMNRKYTKEKYLEIIEYAKQKVSDLFLTSDVIVGYPGETCEDFEKTLDLVKKVGFSSLFTFIYSKRPGTPAAQLPDPISHEQKANWMNELLKIQREISLNIHKNLVGRTLKVLVDKKTENGLYIGRTDGNLLVEIESHSQNLVGSFCNVRIKNYAVTLLKGELS
jgi:tRNA-2-methylthio-N6-dimethylallyladenosine synthase